MNGFIENGNSTLVSVQEAKEVLSKSIDKTTSAYEKLNNGNGGMTEAAGTVTAESSETIDFIIANFEEASTELGNSSDALENIAEDIKTLEELDMDAKIVSDSFGEFVRGTITELDSIDEKLGEQGRILSDVADRTEVDACKAEELAGKVEALQMKKYINRKAAIEAKTQAMSYASEAVAAYKDAVAISDRINDALMLASRLKEDAENKANDARVVYNEAQAKTELAQEELDMILSGNGLDKRSKGFNGDIKVAVDNVKSAFDKASEAANVAAIDLLGRQYELAEAEGKLAVARAKSGQANEQDLAALRSALDRTVEAITSTNESATDAKRAVNVAYDAVMRCADDIKALKLESELDLKALDMAKTRRDEARRVYVEALDARTMAEDNIERAQEASQRASMTAGLEFSFEGGLTKRTIESNSRIGHALNALFSGKNKNKKIYSHNNAI